MARRHLFLLTAILSVGILMVPQVLSLFSGQHDMYDTGQSDDPEDDFSIPCQKCHSDVQYELKSSSIHQTFKCSNCHVKSGSNDSHVSIEAPRCLDCHANGRQVNDSNGNIRIAPIADVFGENISSNEVHIPFIESAKSSYMMKGENEACMACHTRKSLSISWLFYDTYKFNADRLTSSSWDVSRFSKSAEPGTPALIFANESVGKHYFSEKSQLKFKCEKCHPNIRSELNISKHHTNFNCFSCHQRHTIFHAASVPPCLSCHGNPPAEVTDRNGVSFIAPIAPVFSDNIMNGPEPHIPLVSGANNNMVSIDKNEACASCHSSFKNNITFSRPEFVEWDIVTVNGNWIIQNMTYGPMKEINVIKNLDGKVHNISNIENVNCVACHQDIRQAVLNGGHSFEQWKRKHDPGSSDYRDNINSYCKACHRPVTEDQYENSPYPAFPFNSTVHAAMKIACLDCHSKPDAFSVYINGGMRKPPWDNEKMHNVQNSINQQPAFVRSYICIACKNADLPTPENKIHFKLYTEPLIKVYVDGRQQYP
ncbi:MAG: hypothetical protein FIB07_10215 [Candidatus Methanoperedens sp.]|nr:hypothetical protein [Candidatus Methanoperedens sp.]